MYNDLEDSNFMIVCFVYFISLSAQWLLVNKFYSDEFCFNISCFGIMYTDEFIANM